MALNKSELVKLAKTVASANPTSQVAYSFGEEKFSYSRTLGVGIMCLILQI